MADLNRPDYGQVWASTGEKVAPDTVKMQSGWVQEMMPFQYENYLQARQDEAIVYLLQKGVPEYSPAQEYIANKSVVAYQGNLYMATATVTNILPTVTASWKRLNVPLAANGTVPVSSGGTGATTASESRTNLGLGSIATSAAPAVNGIVVKDANDSLVARLITGTSGNITITNPDGVAGNININVGSNVAQLSQDSSWTSKGGIRIPSGSTGERGTEVAGKIRYNTTLQKFEGFDGTSWNALGASSNIEITTLSGNGITTNFTLNSDVFSDVATDVYIGGIYQNKGSYSVSGSTITFSEAPVAGVDNIQVLSRRVADLGLSTATQVSIQDTTNLYTSSTVEGALREVGDKAKCVKNAILSFPDYAAASASAATLPDGQAIVVEAESVGEVSGGLYVADSGVPLHTLPNYAALEAYSGKQSQILLTTPGIYGPVYRDDADTTTAPNGGTIFVDALGRRWKRLAKGSLNIKASGAVPNILINNRESIQNAMNWCAENGVTLIVDDVYYVSADAVGENVDPFALIVPSGLDMRFIGKGELRQLGAPFNKSSVLLIKDTVKANIWNPVITGTRLTESPSLPEQNHGISILECSDVYIHKPVISNTMGDGIYIGRTWVGGGLKSPTRVTVFEPVIDRVRRNGISCTAWDDVEIVRPKITNVRDIDGVSAVLPKSGIDIEPEHDADDGDFKDRLKLTGLTIIDPSVEDCVVSMQVLFSEYCVDLPISVKISGDFRFKATGESGLYPFNLIYVGTGCTGEVVFEKVTDLSVSESGLDTRVSMAWNYQQNGFKLNVANFDTTRKTSGTYAFLWYMDTDAPKYSAAQGGVYFDNVILTDGVRGAVGYRNPASMNATHKITNVRFTSAATALGGRGVENAEYLNTGAIPQGDNCYFDAIRIYDYLPLRGAEWGNRIRLNDAKALQYGKYTLDVRNRLGVFEVLRPWTQTPDEYFIEVVGIATSVSGTPYNAIRSTSRSARAVVRKTEIGVPAEVIETSGEWVAFNVV